MYEGIAQGLEEALAHSRGDKSAAARVVRVAVKSADTKTARKRVGLFQQIVSYAIPDPHIERWMLVDEAAFRTVFGRGCTLPGLKCAKDEYKRLLLKEIRDSGIEPILGGEEFAEDIVKAMNLGKAEIREPSLGLFLKSLKALFNQWRDE